MTWTSEDIAQATGGVPSGPFIADGVSIDTRTLTPGALFVALRAQRDGHDYLDAAAARGAVAALVDRDTAGGLAVVRVTDTIAALRALGAAGRARSGARVVAITGSVGKTTTKAMIERVLAAHGPTHAAAASFNNHIGVPLTLAELPREAAFGVVEIGMNHAGEIAPLASLARPDVAVVTALGSNHIGQLGSEEAIADEKGSIARGLAPGGTLVLPADTPLLQRLISQADEHPYVTFGRADDATVRLRDVALTSGGVAATVTVAGRAVTLRLAAPGTHMAVNAAAAIAVALALGGDADVAARALEGFSPLPGRGATRRIAVPGGAAVLIDEAYNASPASTRAALAVLALQPGRKIAVLGDMLEMGAHAWAAHAGLADACAVADRVYTCGDAARALHDAVAPARRASHAATAAGLIGPLRDDLRDGDAVLIKGSNGMGMAAIVRALEGRA